MSAPKVATIVIYHGSTDWPAIVAVTADNWIESFEGGDYEVGAEPPGPDDCYVYPFTNMNPTMALEGPATEGTGGGQYSLPSYQQTYQQQVV